MTATVVRNSVLIISHNYYLSDCCMHIFGHNLSWKNCIHHYLQVFCNLVKHKESADEKISRFYIHASFISIHFSPISTQNSYSRTLCTRLRDGWLERISLLVSAITKSFAFFLMKVIYKSNSNFFSCICIASDINTHGVYITVSNSPNPLVFIWCNNIPCLSRHLSWLDKVRDLC